MIKVSGILSTIKHTIFKYSIKKQGAKGSLCYRRNQLNILRGQVPEKYLRIAPFVKGDAVLEIGAAEGVLSLVLAGSKKRVIALERSKDRHAAALELKEKWRKKGKDVSRCEMVLGDVMSRIDLLEGVDTLVGVRCIYYFKEDTDRFFAEVSKKVRHIVLCGNGGRAKRYQAEGPTEKLGEYEYYASEQGMIDLLKRHGYRITQIVSDGDAIVVGEKADDV